LVNFHTKKPATHNKATPPATESPMIVDVDMPELPPPPELLLPEVDEGGAEEAAATPSVAKTTLVTTWPPAFVVTRAEVTVAGVSVAELLAALVGVLEVCAGACVVDCCAADA
jgi:hypothetical protein